MIESLEGVRSKNSLNSSELCGKTLIKNLATEHAVAVEYFSKKLHKILMSTVAQ